jgi:hypothetical protein
MDYNLATLANGKGSSIIINIFTSVQRVLFNSAIGTSPSQNIPLNVVLRE